MRFTDNAILLSVTKYSESTAICRLFGRDYGLISGAVRGAMSKKQRGNYQVGNVLKVEWSARLAEHLGSLKCENLAAISAYFMQDNLRLSALNSLVSLTQQTMAEHDPHPMLYDALIILLEKMKHGDGSWLIDYARFELQLLSECGFQLELSRCVVTGEVENLAYVSPKSGCAVTAHAAGAYKARLLKLPSFFVNDEGAEEPVLEDVKAAFALTGYFLEHRLFASHSQDLPKARQRFLNALGSLEVMPKTLGFGG